MKLFVVLIIIFLSTILSRRDGSDEPNISIRAGHVFKVYRNVYIKHLVENAINTNSSVGLQINASNPIYFGLLKCDVFAIATISEVRQANYIFEGKSLKNLHSLIYRTCKFDNHTKCIELLLRTPSSERTEISVTFSILPRNTHHYEITSVVKSMYPSVINFDLSAETSSNHPIQLKAMLLMVLENPNNTLRISSSPPANVTYSVQRCDKQIPRKTFVSVVLLELYEVEQLMDLFVGRNCHTFWLDGLEDSCIFQLFNSANQTISGSLVFEVLDRGQIEKENQLKKAVSIPITKKSVLKNRSFWFIAIFCAIIIVFAIVWIRHKRMKRQTYHVAKYEANTRLCVHDHETVLL